jgi:transposase InsO family protein
MYRIVSQPINFRYIGNSGIVKAELPEDFKYIVKICEHGLKYGYKAAIEAFDIGKSTYYTHLKEYRLYLEHGIVPVRKSKRPHNIREANWHKYIVRFICRIRTNRPNIGKSKIKPHLDEYCTKHGIATISTGTIQNIINSFENKLRTKKSILSGVKRKSEVLRKPSNYKATSAGECISLDSMEFRRDGKKLYVVAACDEATGLMYARATNSHTSRSAKEILESAHNYLPYQHFNIILTDNGSEFAKDFAQYVKDNNIVHYHTYPRTPKQNAICERLNRSIQDEFMILHENLLFDDINKFNRKLNEYLHWYNFKRVHARFDNKITPYKRFLQLTERGKITE